MITALLIILPFLAGLILLVLGNKMAKLTALAISLVELAICCFAFIDFNPEGGTQYIYNTPWIPSLGISFFVGMDGISLLLIALTGFLVPLIILSSFRNHTERPALFYALILIMQSGLIGVFAARDAFLFYIFWELALIPIYFIALLWGGENRAKITFKFFIYTLVGSLFMLLGIIYLYLQTPGAHSFSINEFYVLSSKLSATEQSYVFLAFLLAFAIKMPIFPFHTWQPATYTNAPTQGTMLLSGIMLKMGTYGVIMWMLPVVPQGFYLWGKYVIILAVIGVVYASVIAIMQKNFKTLIAYSSIAHVGLIAAGMFTQSAEGLQGAVIQMLSHGINVVGIFFIVDILFDRTGSLQLSEMGGLRNQAPKLAIFFLIILMANVALPLTNGFVGELMLFISIYKYNAWIAAAAGLSIILGAVYMLNSYQKIMLGEKNQKFDSVKDLMPMELMVLVPIVILIFWIGIYPKPFLAIAEPSVKNIIQFAGSNLSLIR